MDDLLPCPFCGESDVEAYRAPLSVVWHVYCTTCEIHGHGEPSEAEARSAWNRRSSPPLPSDRMVERLTPEVANLRRHLDIALDTLKMEGACGDECNACAEAKAALSDAGRASDRMVEAVAMAIARFFDDNRQFVTSDCRDIARAAISALSDDAP